MTANASSEARVLTASPQRYLSQLCKHFQHKLPVTLAPDHGSIRFSSGVCELDAAANPGTLMLHLTANDESALIALQDIVARHLRRFAFREEPEVQWTRAE